MADADLVWECRATGNDANGGAYDPVAATTDFSQQDNPALTLTDVVTNGTTTVTSATGGFSMSHVGNTINVAGSIRRITARTNGNTITVNALISSGSGQAGRIGGALATPGKLASAIYASNFAWMREAIYNVSSTANVSGGRPVIAVSSSTRRTTFRGYSTVRGDFGRPTIRQTTNGSSCFAVSGGIDFDLVDIIGDGASTGVTIFNLGASRARLIRSAAQNTTGQGVNATQVGLIEVTATSCDRGMYFGGFADRCRAVNCGAAGFNEQGAGTIYVDCIASGCGNGFEPLGASMNAKNCIAYNCTTGFNGSSAAAQFTVSNSIAYGCTTGFSSGGSRPSHVLLNCAGGGNTTNYSTTDYAAASVSGFVALAANPFIDAPNGDFRLNAYGRQMLQAKGYGVFPGLPNTIGYADIGTAQTRPILIGEID